MDKLTRIIIVALRLASVLIGATLRALGTFTFWGAFWLRHWRELLASILAQPLWAQLMIFGVLLAVVHHTLAA
ncbi:hypothetical protein [Burkholderia ambifaria]|uniref:hypothetical protein n=1 Tax=Burkholderia ambifaria TaxID=152480 RepID=UPI00158B413D|nr:hypothetical protein [Burkholderia ambifaria]